MIISNPKLILPVAFSMLVPRWDLCRIGLWGIVVCTAFKLEIYTGNCKNNSSGQNEDAVGLPNANYKLDHPNKNCFSNVIFWLLVRCAKILLVDDCFSKIMAKILRYWLESDRNEIIVLNSVSCSTGKAHHYSTSQDTRKMWSQEHQHMIWSYRIILW